jgi:DNA repair exonuclease SbcCD ATPase subunit
MIVKQLTIKNFMGYKKRCSLDFRNKETIAIVGANESGKSSILAAICYATFGDTPSLGRVAREVSLISDYAKEDLVIEEELELDNGESLVITRGRTQSNKPILKLEGYNGKPSELSQIISEKVGISFSDFITLSCFVQGDIHQFMDGNKREYFQRWAEKLKQWELYEKIVKEKESELVVTRDRIVSTIDQLVVTPKILNEARRERDVVKSKLAEILKNEAIIKSQIDKLSESIARENLKSVEISAEEKSLCRELQQINNLVQSLETQEHNHRRQLADIRDCICPILKEDCSRLAQHTSQKQTKLKIALKAVQDNLTDARNRKEIIIGKISGYRRQQVTPTNKHSTELQDLKKEYSEIQVEKNRLNIKSGRLIERVAELKKQREQVRSSKEKLESLDVQLRRIRFIHAMCGRSGIPMEIMKSELGSVEDHCNWVLSRLDYPKRLKFDAYRELVSYEKVCPYCGSETWRSNDCASCGRARPHKREDEPAVTILDGAMSRPFALESGGARVLQSFAVRLACSLFRASMTGRQIKMIMLDEVFAMLDASNRQKLMSLIIGKLASEFGLKQQFIISHQEDVSGCVDNILRVVKHNGSSIATWL